MHILKRSLLLLGVTALTLTACKDDAVAPDTIAVTSITVSPPSVSVQVGQSVTVSATVNTNGGTGTIDPGVNWLTSNASIATVNAAGSVTGVAAGSTTVTAQSKENTSITQSIAVTVTALTQVNALTSFAVTPTAVSIVSGQTATTSNVVVLATGGSVSYANVSSNPARCTVPATGANPTITTLTAGGTGNCVITITATGTGTGLVTNSIAQTIAVTVTASPTALLSLTVLPTSVNMIPGATQAVTTTTTVTPGAAVTFANTSSNPAVATVTATGANPTITATGNGVAQITINATGTGTGLTTNSIQATIQVNVQAASVSISGLTACLGGPPCTVQSVVLAGVFGQIDATMNINTGFQQLASVAVFIGPPVAGVCPAPTSPTYVEAARQNFGVNGAPPAPVTLTINTARFSASTFAPDWRNGLNCILARVFPSDVSQPVPSASNTIQFTLVNPDVVYFDATNPLAINAGTGFGTNHTGTSAIQVAGGGGAAGSTWYKGGFNFRAHPVLYSGDSVVSIRYTSTACNGAGVLALPPTFTATFSCAAVQSAQNIANAVLINYTPGYTLTVSPTTFMTAASPGFVPGSPIYSVVSTQEDNVAPVIVLSNVAFNDLFDQMWVNAAYAFLGDFTFSDVGVGVNLASRSVRTFGTAGVLPAQPALACSASNPTVVTGADLSETLTSDGSPEGYKVCATGADALVNVNAGSAGSNFFGVDKGAPTSRLAGTTAATPSIAPSTPSSVSSVANTTIFGDATPRPVMPATDVWGLEALDGRAGFNQNVVAGFPSVQTLARLAPLAPTSCGLFTSPLSAPLSDNFVRVAVLVALDCAQGLGYYTYNGFVVDRAGNASTTITRNFARDHVLAPTLASIGLNVIFYTAGAQADFFLFGSDDLEIIEGDVSISYPNGGLVTATIEGITYPLAAINNALRWDALLNNNVLGGVISVPSLLGRVDFTCTGAGTPYASCLAADGVATVAAEFNNVAATNNGQNPDSVRAVAYDVASNVSNAVASGILTAQVTDVAQQWVGADLLRWRVLSTAGATVTAEHMASTSITAPYFDSVLLARADAGATEIRICGTFPNTPPTNPALTDNGFNRFWTYTITKPTGTAQCATGGAWYVIGIKAGAALISIGVP